MKKIQYLLFLCFLTACVEQHDERENNIQQTVLTDLEDEEISTDFAALRQELIAAYDSVIVIDTVLRSNAGKTMHLYSQHYCLFDNGLYIPGQYVYESPSKPFATHNYAHDITLVVAGDTVFNRTISKSDFSEMLYEEHKKYAALFYPRLSYDAQTNIVGFRYSISIPITDIGVGVSLSIDEQGQMTIQ